MARRPTLPIPPDQRLAPAARRPVGHVHQRRVEAVLDVLDRTGATSAAEVGSGTGAVLRSVAAARPRVRFTGYEADERLVAYARLGASSAVDFFRVDVGAGGLPRVHDLVWSIDEIHHLSHPGRAFRAVRESLPSGGTWLVIEPNIWHPYVTIQQERMRRWGLDEDHFRPWRLVPEMRAAGFRVRSKRYLHAVPGAVRQMTGPAAGAERLAERVAVLGASVVYELERRP